MSLFDPYSHTRLLELRQEQLARKAARRKALRLDEEPLPGMRDGAARVLRALAARVATTNTAERQQQPTTPAHPEAR